jgi:hypothetical protein
MKLETIDRRARIELEARRMRARLINDLVSRAFRRTPSAAAPAGTV